MPAASGEFMLGARIPLAPDASAGGRRQLKAASFGHFLPGQCPKQLSTNAIVRTRASDFSPIVGRMLAA